MLQELCKHNSKPPGRQGKVKNQGFLKNCHGSFWKMNAFGQELYIIH